MLAHCAATTAASCLARDPRASGGAQRATPSGVGGQRARARRQLFLRRASVAGLALHHQLAVATAGRCYRPVFLARSGRSIYRPSLAVLLPPRRKQTPHQPLHW
jgi:hypothetical protein